MQGCQERLWIHSASVPPLRNEQPGTLAARDREPARDQLSELVIRQRHERRGQHLASPGIALLQRLHFVPLQCENYNSAR